MSYFVLSEDGLLNPQYVNDAHHIKQVGVYIFQQAKGPIGALGQCDEMFPEKYFITLPALLGLLCTDGFLSACKVEN